LAQDTFAASAKMSRKTDNLLVSVLSQEKQKGLP